MVTCHSLTLAELSYGGHHPEAGTLAMSPRHCHSRAVCIRIWGLALTRSYKLVARIYHVLIGRPSR